MKSKLLILPLLLVLSSCSGGESTTATSSSSPSSEVPVSSSQLSEESESSSSASSSISSSKPLTSLEQYLAARKATLELGGYAYSDSLEVLCDISVLPETSDPNGLRTGSIEYVRNSSPYNVACYTNSGLLFNDGTRYEIAQGNSKQVVTINEEGDVEDIDVKDVSSIADYTSTYAKAVFVYSDDEFKDATLSNGVYTITTKMSASSIISDAISALDNPIVRYFIPVNYPDLEPDYTLTATLSNGYIDKFTYSLSLEVSGQKLSITYAMDFTNYNLTSVNVPSFPGASFSEADLEDDITAINNALSEYRTRTRSGYNYKTILECDFPGGTPLLTDCSTTVQGEAIRVLQDDTVYYHNTVKMDTNLPDWGSLDYEYFRANLLDGRVYDAEDTLGWNNSYVEVINPLESDEYYFLFESLNIGDYYYATDETKNGITTHRFILKDTGTSNLLAFLESGARLDPSLASHPKALGNWSNIVLKEGDYEIALSSTGLESINIDLEGTFSTVIPNNDESGEAEFRIRFELEVDDTLATDYEIPKTEEDIRLS